MGSVVAESALIGQTPLFHYLSRGPWNIRTFYYRLEVLEVLSMRSKLSEATMAKIAVLVAALGYFVDVYDILLFSVVRIPSLKELGFSGEELLSNGVHLLNLQMGGMLVGGILWGVWGDKFGRVSVLFGSITLYSIANIANAYVETFQGYEICRVVAGLGLAGELGAGITLVSECLSKDGRGFGTTFVASIGVTGAVVAALVGDLFHWRTAYLIGGAMGLMLLLLRVAVHESGMFNRVVKTATRRGDLFLLLSSRERVIRFLSCIAVGLPIWFAVGILITFSPEFAKEFGMQELPTAARAVLYCYLGLVLGDVASGLLSQYLRSRRRVVLMFIGLTALSTVWYLNLGAVSLANFYTACGILGFATGYWAVFVTSAAEQFGTNLRATVTTIVPNFVRGSVVPVTLSFEYFKAKVGIIASGAIVGASVCAIALIALLTLRESFARDLDFIEE